MKKNKNPILYAEYESAYATLLKAEYMLIVQELMIAINIGDINAEEMKEERINRLINIKKNTIYGIQQYMMTIDKITQELEDLLKEMI